MGKEPEMGESMWTNSMGMGLESNRFSMLGRSVGVLTSLQTPVKIVHSYCLQK